MSTTNLQQKVVKSGFWAFALRVVQRIFNLVRLIILARILSPHDFGLMGIALLIMGMLETFSQTGFHAALIQRRERIEPYLNSAWTFLIVRGLMLFTILYLIAPYASSFFNSPEAEPIIRVMGLAILLRSFTNIGVIYYQKELEFNKVFALSFTSVLADFTVAVSAALILQNVWALVYGYIAGNLVMCVMSYIIHPYRPRLDFDVTKAKELFGFGRWILGSSILTFLITQGDSAFVGKLLGATALGFYQMAYRISNLPTTEISHVISWVTFPAYSKLQDNIEKLRQAYLRVLQVTTFITFPLAGLILVLAPEFTRLFLGEKWMPMVPAMQVLVIFGLVRSIGATTGPLLQGIGRPDIITKIQFIRLIITFILIYPLTVNWNIVGTSVAVTLSILTTDIGFIYPFIIIKIIRMRVNEFIKNMIHLIIGSLTMSTFLVIFKFIYKIYISYIWFVVLVIISTLLYFGITLINKDLRRDILNIIKVLSKCN